MADRLADWVALVDAVHPESDAEPWDQTGLQVGDPADEITTVLLALDATEVTVAEARAARAQLLLTHHPLLFRPLGRLTPQTAPGRVALAAARSGVAVLAAHTNLDAAEQGTTSPILDLLDLQHVRPLAPAAPPGRGVKLVTFVPAEATDGVLAALAGAGAGVIGGYTECAFVVRGTGTFRPGDGARPAVGDVGLRNVVPEDRLEMVVPPEAVADAVAALLSAHPYEEVAYDLVPLAPLPGHRSGKGLGRVGRLHGGRPLGEVADVLCAGLPAPFLRVAGDLARPVQVVAACGGAGDSLVDAALAAGADVYVTGDLRHHVALDALTMGMAVIDAGHAATEAAALPAFAHRLSATAADRGLTARLLPSAARTEPWAAYRPPGSGEGGAS